MNIYKVTYKNPRGHYTPEDSITRGGYSTTYHFAFITAVSAARAVAAVQAAFPELMVLKNPKLLGSAE